MRCLATALALTLAAHGAYAKGGDWPVRDGDLVFQTSHSAQSVAVQRATHSPLSHMGIVLVRQGEPMVLEAADTVRYTPLRQWVAHGKNGHVVVKRLQDATTVLTPAAVSRLHTHAQALLGTPYDLTFEWSDRRMYCSELVWKLYQRALGIELGKLQRIRDFDLSDPQVQQTMRQRYGTQVPLQEPVISPAAMAEAPRLVTVLER